MTWWHNGSQKTQLSGVRFLTKNKLQTNSNKNVFVWIFFFCQIVTQLSLSWTQNDFIKFRAQYHLYCWLGKWNLVTGELLVLSFTQLGSLGKGWHLLRLNSHVTCLVVCFMQVLSYNERISLPNIKKSWSLNWLHTTMWIWVF